MKLNNLLNLNLVKTGLIGLTAIYLASCAAPNMAPSVSESSRGLSDNAVSTAESYKVQSTPQPRERPGLGTSWGDDVASTVNFTGFTRANASPDSIASIYYNDKEGIKAMTSSWSYDGKGLQQAANGMVEWGVKGNWGYLRNKHSNGKRFVIADKNQSYSLVVKNLCKSRLEIVMSVDGLDVIDGQPASIRKRGYIVQPGDTLTVKGFRKSTDAVAAFKFSSVNSSYTNLSGKGTRNIGVMGMAVFTENGIDPWKYGATELNTRTNAHAFAEAPQLRAR